MTNYEKAVRNLVDRGRVMYAIDNYKKGRASLGRAAELAGFSVGEMMDILAEFRVDSKVSVDDYLEGLKSLRKHW